MHLRPCFEKNPQSRNAANGPDLVKHTIWLALLDELRRVSPWRERLVVHECHAAAGLYRISRALNRPASLHIKVLGEEAMTRPMLGVAQSYVLGVIGAARTRHYAGSPLLTAAAIGHHANASLEACEYDPVTRRDMEHNVRCLCTAMKASVNVTVPGNAGMVFESEPTIAKQLPGWDSSHVLCLDPFDIWSTQADLGRRQRLADTILAAAHNNIPTVVFFCWKDSAFGRAEMNGGHAPPVVAGYTWLRDQLRAQSMEPVVVAGEWGFPFAVWTVGLDESRAPVAKRIYYELEILLQALLGARALPAEVALTVDGTALTVARARRARSKRAGQGAPVTPRVLIFDDDLVRDLRGVEFYGIDVRLEGTADRAEKVVASYRPTVVLMDHNFLGAERSGVDAVEALRKTWDKQTLPIIGISSLQATNAALVHAGANASMSKRSVLEWLRSDAPLQVNEESHGNQSEHN